MLDFHCSNVWVEVDGIKAEVDYLRLILRFGADDDTSLLTEDLLGGPVFPTGLLDRVCKLLTESNVKYQVHDRPKVNDGEIVIPQLTDLEFYPTQVSALQKALYYRRGIVQSPTGSGKTELATAIAMAAKDRRTLTVIPGVNSMKQTHRRYLCRGLEDVGRIGDEFWEGEPQHTVAVVNSLYRGVVENRPEVVELLRSVHTLLLIEAHHSKSLMWQTVANNCVNASVRIALTATPYDKPHAPTVLDDYKIIGATGEIISQCPEHVMMNKGFMPTPKVLMLDMPPPPYVTHNNWLEIKKTCITNMARRNDAICQMATSLVERGYKVMTLVNERNIHGHPLSVKMSEMSDDVFFFAGQNTLTIYRNGKKRSVKQVPIDKLASDLMERDSYNLVGSPAVHEDADFPDAQVVIIAGAGRSFKKTIQCAGRVLRGSGTVYIIDFNDKTGFVMQNQARTRMKWYQECYGRAKNFSLQKFDAVEDLLKEIP